MATALGWPSWAVGGPGENLAILHGRDAAAMDAWQMFRLFTGLARLCDTLAGLHEAGLAHRCLTPAGIIVLDDGRLVLRDLGLAARDPEPGEGPAGYRAAEQRRGGDQRPGPRTDVYQLAAVAYHLVAGHPPHARMPLPLRAQGSPARRLPPPRGSIAGHVLASNTSESAPGSSWTGSRCLGATRT